MKAAPNPFFEKEPIKFFDSGWISFKGITVAVHEVLFTEAEFYKLQYEPQMIALYKAIDSNNWKDAIFTNLLTLLMKVFRSMPAFKIETIEIGRKIQLSNEDCLRLCNEILQLFRVKQDYRKAIHQLERLVELIKIIPQFDRLCMEYAGAILHAYSSVLEEYNSRIETKIEEKVPQVLPQKYRTLYEEGRRGAEVYQRLRERLYQTLTPLELSLIWSNVIDQCQHNLEVYIHSGKQEQL